jgi:hypothetical protein
MQPGQDWDGDNGTGALDRPTQGRILAQCQVRADLIVVRCISRKNLPQVRCTKDQHPVQAFAAHGANQTLHIRFLPWRSRRDRSVSDAHGPHPGLEDISVGTVIVAHQVGRCRCPQEGLGDLSGQPLRRRMSRHLEPQQLPPAMAHNKKGKQPLEGQGWNHAQIDRRNRVRMASQRESYRIEFSGTTAGFITIIPESSFRYRQGSSYPAGAAASLHRPDPIMIVAVPSFVVELAYVKISFCRSNS